MDKDKLSEPQAQDIGPPNVSGNPTGDALPSPTPAVEDAPLAAWFLGPRAENAPIWEEMIHGIFQDYVHWRRNYFPADPVVVGRARRRSELHEAWLDQLTASMEWALNELKHHFPFHSPRYVGHMLSEQTLPALMGYFAGLLYNPNNVTDEAAPVTVDLELEVGRWVAAMLGYNPRTAWAHITSGGTIAHVEALWVARSAQFAPLFVQQYCEDKRLDFQVKLANQSTCIIRGASPRDLLSLRPNEAIFMLRKLVHFIHALTGRPPQSVLEEVNGAFANSSVNVAKVGFPAVLAATGLKPVLFASAAAHYSVPKAANILGYGESAVRLIPVTSSFQMDISALERALFRLKDDEYVVGVVPIVGTTEEGAVDPVHRVRFLRDELQEKHNRSFWIHVDAAWGGYIRSLFCGAPLPRQPRGQKLPELSDAYVRALDVSASMKLFSQIAGARGRSANVRWANRDIYSAYLALSDADSVVIDPHKMGYVPYPAGMVAFRNGLVTELVRQRAQYIAADDGGIRGIDEMPTIDRVGGYILEGSKPGAVALGCWLAHKTIPLTFTGHGQIVKTSLLSAKKLFKLLVNHRHFYMKIHERCFPGTVVASPFTFEPIYEPDTNVVCFVVRPMALVDGRLTAIDTDLQLVNDLGRGLYKCASISARDRHERSAAAQPFYLSRTELLDKQYSAKSMSLLLRRLGIGASDYKKKGVFVLRCAVMNPWYGEAKKAGVDYLEDFVYFLHRATAEVIEDIQRERTNSAGVGAVLKAKRAGG